MMSKYGKIDKKIVNDYLSKLINRVWKIIPMNEKEEERIYIDKYVESLVREITGVSIILDTLEGDFLTIAGTLNGLRFDNHSSVRSDIFKIIDIIKRIREESD